MVIEVGDITLPEDSQQIEAAEHSRKSKAKKVIDGAVFYSVESGATKQTVNLSTSPEVGQNKCFRLVHTASFHFNIANRVKTATTSDIYVPADTVVIVATRELTHINVTAAVNAIEVE